VNANPNVRPDVALGSFRLVSPRVALLLGGLALGLLIAAVPLSVMAHQFGVGGLGPVLFTIPFAGVGALVASRQPGNPIGWILLLLALGVTIGGDAGFYSVFAYQVEGHGLLLSRLAVVLATGWIALIVLLPLPILLFPDGRLPSRRWRWTLWLYLLLAAVSVVALAIGDSAAFTDRTVKVDSAGELASMGSSSTSTAAAVQLVVIIAYALISLSWVTRQLLGYRHETGERRQQLKWLISGGAICIIGLVGSLLLSGARSTLWGALSEVGYVSVGALPIGIGVGILKYRLYDIDRLISRTLSYVIITGLLVGVFVGIVVLATDVLPFSSPVAVAASTLAAAALFNPLRLRVQRLVDRRFNRARYDAEAIVAAFTLRLRDAVDLDTVRGELLLAVDRAVEPAHASLWIRPPERSLPVR
jgi:hypothetical protein